MFYFALADAILILHLAFILFVVLGGFLVLWRRWLIRLHLPVVVWGVLIEFAGWICPLTPLENWLRMQGGDRGFSGGFINHYLVSLIYPEGLTRELQWLLGALVLAINAGIYFRVWRARTRSGA
ncbi:MAG: putative rane protein [Steroidobacteraceae bacterium]|nr:putative rane protein [Steroidobacteraceae bacterium]MBM2853538.1 putative rane protein [Steroidobacteraceae bacterium]